MTNSAKNRLAVLYITLISAATVCNMASAKNNTESASSKPIIEMQLLPAIGVPGQIRRLEIDILTPSYFLKAPIFPDIKIDGAIVLAPRSFGLNFTERRAGTSYTVQRQEYLVFPQRHGAFLIRPITVGLTVPGEDGFTPKSVTVTSPQLSFLTHRILDDTFHKTRNHAGEIKPQSQPSAIVGRNFSLNETYSEHFEIKVGDVLRREVNLTAKDTLGMFLPSLGGELPPLETNAEILIPGGRLYRRVSDIGEISNRGKLVARRSEIWQYIFEKPGKHIIPGIQITYWDLESTSWQALKLEEKTIFVKEKTLLKSNISNDSDITFFPNNPVVNQTIVMTLIIIGLLLPFLPLLIRKFSPWKEKHLMQYYLSEPFQWRELKRYTRRLDRPSIDNTEGKNWHRAYYHWLAHYPLLGNSVTTPKYLQATLSTHYMRPESVQSSKGSTKKNKLLKTLRDYRKELKSEVRKRDREILL